LVVETKRTPLDGRALIEVQADFVYEAARQAAIAAGAPIVPRPFAEREKAFQEQFFDTIAHQCSLHRSTDPEVVHDQWMASYFKLGWVYGKEYSLEQCTHPDLVPFDQLGQLEQDKDAVYIALCEIARLYIRGE
jgi:hypothetical protein